MAWGRAFADVLAVVVAQQVPVGQSTAPYRLFPVVAPRLSIVGAMRDAVEGIQVLLVGIGERMHILLCGLDVGVAHAFHNALEV